MRRYRVYPGAALAVLLIGTLLAGTLVIGFHELSCDHTTCAICHLALFLPIEYPAANQSLLISHQETPLQVSLQGDPDHWEGSPRSPPASSNC